MIFRLLDLATGLEVMASLAIGLFFFRFFRQTGDRLFLAFAATFWILSVNWLGLVFVGPEHEARTYLYVLRLVAFTLLIVAIVDKNRKAR